MIEQETRRDLEYTLAKIERESDLLVKTVTDAATAVKIHVSPKRNPHSGKLGRIVTLKDHDLCRRCWRQIIRNCREAMLTYEWHVPALAERREVA